MDSELVQDLPPMQRSIYTHHDTHLPPEELFRVFSKRMTEVGRDPENQRPGGNSTKKLRFIFAGNPSEAQLIRNLGWGMLDENETWDNNIPIAEFDCVTHDLIRHAVQDLIHNSPNHPFGRSVGYDVIADSEARLPPKAVFGLAASKALGFEMRPEHFKGGRKSHCFRAIREAGYEIVRKDAAPPTSELPINPDDLEWTEGNNRRVTHLVRERASGLSAAKKSAFVQQHARLFCERCGLDPVADFGEGIGEACIEVHHTIPLSKIRKQQPTRLDDLVCLCANCHRMVHYELRHSTG